MGCPIRFTIWPPKSNLILTLYVFSFSPNLPKDILILKINYLKLTKLWIKTSLVRVSAFLREIYPILFKVEVFVQ